MNLFLVGWDLPGEARERGSAALRSMTEAFPLLDPSTTGTWEGPRVFATWMHWPIDALGVRRYVHQSMAALTLFDGVAVDESKSIIGHDATSLEAHWDTLSERLEGHYAAIRLTRRPERLEIVNDPFGLHPVFVHAERGAWWLSNSVMLLVRATGLRSLDLVGLANFLALDQPGDDRTLVEGVSALPAAQHWVWSSDQEPTRACYAPILGLGRLGRRSFGALEAAALADTMGGQLRALAAANSPLMCPITAGRDTRVIVGLMLDSGLPGDYFTAGDPAGIDARYGALIASRFDLPHRLTGHDHDGLIERWDDLSRRSVLQTDGLVTLAHASNLAAQPTRLERVSMQLYGAGGEIARGGDLGAAFVLGRPSVADAVKVVIRKSNEYGSLLRSAVRQSVHMRVAERVRQMHGHGVRVVDLPMAFSVTENNRRWSASQARQIAGHMDVFMPLYCRAYARAAFTTPPLERLMERVPFALLTHLSPDLRGMPTDVPWPPQRPLRLLLAREVARLKRQRQRLQRRLWRHRPVSSGFVWERRRLVDVLVRLWRTRFLDRSQSPLWELLKREAVESLTAPGASPLQRSVRVHPLFQVATVFAFEEVLGAWADWHPHEWRSTGGSTSGAEPRAASSTLG